MSFIHLKHYRDDYVPNAPCKTFRDILAAIEVDNLELPDGPPDSSYMFTAPDDVDMDAFNQRYISRHEMGAAPDAGTFFDKLSARFGFECRREAALKPDLAPGPAPEPAPTSTGA